MYICIYIYIYVYVYVNVYVYYIYIYINSGNPAQPTQNKGAHLQYGAAVIDFGH